MHMNKLNVNNDVTCGTILIVIAISVVMSLVAACLVFLGFVYRVGADGGIHPTVAFSLAIGCVASIVPIVFSLRKLRRL